jgi:hypothetical protein
VGLPPIYLDQDNTYSIVSARSTSSQRFGRKNMQQIQEFRLSKTTVVCPSCQAHFETPQLEGVPPIAPGTPVETDLHRILPNAAIRAALVTSCQECRYTWWTSAFQTETRTPGLLTADEYSLERLEYPRRFARAYLTGKLIHAHARELAIVLLNGAWCAREAGLEHLHWLALAAREFAEAFADKNWRTGRGHYLYLMGEISRQLSDFGGAIEHYNLAESQTTLPPELLLRQKVQATAADNSPTRLPAHMVERIFCPRGARIRFLPGSR